MSLTAHYDFRERLSEYLVRDLLGPAAPDEVIEDLPLTRYAVGVLYAKQSGTLDPEQDIDDSEDDGDGEIAPADPPVALANMRYPSSMGLTFAVDPKTAGHVTIRVVGAARYEEVESPVEPTTGRKQQSPGDPAPGPVARPGASRGFVGCHQTLFGPSSRLQDRWTFLVLSGASAGCERRRAGDGRPAQ